MLTIAQPSSITVRLPRPHAGQRAILAEADRFNVICCGRRWGKTTMALDLLMRPALEGYPVAYFAPTYKMLIEFWRTLREVADPVTRRSSEQERRIELITGGKIEMWSLTEPNVARGRKYRRAVPDEAAMVEGLLDAWQQVIRPTLADLRGDAWFLSTPRGESDFQTMYQYAGQLPQWRAWQRSTHDNPHIDPDEIRAMERDMPPDVYAQEVMAEFVTIAATQFLPSLTLWDALQEPPPAYDPRDPIVCALDASVDGDTFGLVGVGRRPGGGLTVRLVMAWVPNGQPLDYATIEAEIRAAAKRMNIYQIAYDPYQAHYLAQRLSDTIWCAPFNQGADRLEADRMLLDTVIQRGLSHDGDARLRSHLANADRKIDADGRRLRIVKRTPEKKIDLAVCLSMACYRALTEFQL
jgi:Phage Terminase/Terminase large subunit, T4likevirus-type, N-terminal